MTRSILAANPTDRGDSLANRFRDCLVNSLRDDLIDKLPNGAVILEFGDNAAMLIHATGRLVHDGVGFYEIQNRSEVAPEANSHRGA
jgi:hypothetical protein